MLAEAAAALQKLLQEAAQALHPFPVFAPGSFVQAVEVEASTGVDRGCVVVCPDGELYQYVLKMEPPTPEWDVVPPERTEEVTPLDLPILEYLVYASSALSRLAELHSQRQGATPPG